MDLVLALVWSGSFPNRLWGFHKWQELPHQPQQSTPSLTVASPLVHHCIRGIPWKEGTRLKNSSLPLLHKSVPEVHIYKGILLSRKMNEKNDICSNIDEAIEDHTKWIKDKNFAFMWALIKRGYEVAKLLNSFYT